MACLTLVRPPSMSDEAASDWVAVAAGQLSDLSDYEIRKGANVARNECTFHSQIIPTIRKANAEAIAYRKQMDALAWDRPTHRPTPQIEHRGGTKRIGNLKLVEDMRHD